MLSLLLYIFSLAGDAIMTAQYTVSHFQQGDSCQDSTLIITGEV